MSVRGPYRARLTVRRFVLGTEYSVLRASYAAQCRYLRLNAPVMNQATIQYSSEVKKTAPANDTPK